jgi:signal transduction histidine kinase
VRSGNIQLQRIRRFTEVSRALTNAASLGEVFQLTAERAAELVGAEISLLMLADSDGVLAIRASCGVDPTLASQIREPMSELLVPRLAELLGATGKSFVAVPLVVSGTITGVLVVVRNQPAASAVQDEWLLSALADQAAIALEKNHLDEIGVFREQLMAIVGHDLRNPLNSIAMAAEVLLNREGLGIKETELTRKITRGTALALRLIDQLLDFTRSRLGGGIALEPAVFDMNDVCRQVIDETELRNPDRALQVEIRGDLVGVWDRDRMYQLLSNLLGNAVTHGAPDSPIKVLIETDETGIAIEVANRGKPIPEAVLPFVFDAFRQGRVDHSSRKGGLGLGLFIAQQIARAHGGSIAVTSSDSKGTSFLVRMPRRVTGADALIASSAHGV